MLTGAYTSQNFDFEWDADPTYFFTKENLFYISSFCKNDFQRIIEMNYANFAHLQRDSRGYT